MVQPTKRIFAVQLEPAILQACVQRCHSVSCVCDGDARSKEIWSEDDTTVGEPQLCVFKSFAIGLALLAFLAIGEVCTQPCCQLFVLFEVAEPGTEFSGGWLPDQ